MLKITNFVLHVKKENGKIEKMYNCCIDKRTATKEEAIKDGLQYFNKNKERNLKSKYKLQREYWKKLTPVYITFDYVDENMIFKETGKILI